MAYWESKAQYRELASSFKCTENNTSTIGKIEGFL